ncbi:hypothetical protein SteCoe_17621 [Stentor coeruleus]|uniref:Uncharacterized protein n=1 Tax=Stentor coeruleus TaxID=5963 RepID=A0A1R2BYZ2_9CILI|nr:hypothetical protein SteCoe_17621 [Stentor coeruleus]
MSTKNSRPSTNCNKSSYVTSVQGRFTPDFRSDCMRAKSFDKQISQDSNSSRKVLNTPNFSKREGHLSSQNEFFDQQTTFGHEKKLKIPKLPLDTLLEEDSVSLNLSTICMENPENAIKKIANEGNELLKLLECPEDWENSESKNKRKKYACLDESSIVDSHCRVLVQNKNTANVPPLNDVLRKQAQKYDKALILLQAHFQTYKEHSEKQIMNLTQDLAEAKAVLKCQMQERNNIVGSMKNKIKEAKTDLENQFKSHLDILEKKLCEKEQYKLANTDERIQRLRKDFERKASDSAREERARSSSRGFNVLVEENKKLREDLTNLWKDTDKISQKLQKK